MTLSRFDEWTGVRSTSNNRDANYGLYSFRDPHTPYPRAFWHPGIGIWQYDSAGLGAPFNAVERMDAGKLAADAATTMASRLCAAQDAGASDLESRYAAWSPWGHPCLKCEDAFQELYGTAFASLRLVDGIDRLGGVLQRSCSFGAGSPFPCWYVDPSRAQGARSWVDGLPVNDGDPTDPDGPGGNATPLSTPFYVFTADGQEQRHWLREDSGYGIDISARRNLGKNARPRSHQTGSGLDWRATSSLCDRTLMRGRCDPIPPDGTQVEFPTVRGSYAPFMADLDGNGLDDVVWYGSGGAPDHIWWFDGSGSFTAEATIVNGSYTPTPGDFDGDGDEDILWYSAAGPDYLWMFDGRRYSGRSATIGPNVTLVPAEIDGDGALEVIAYGTGATPDRLLDWNGSGFTTTPLQISGTYTPLTGDFDGDGTDDVIWYAPGRSSDFIWLTGPGGAIESSAIVVNGDYEPFVADLDGDGRDDVTWYAPGPVDDYLWFGTPNGEFVGLYQPVSGSYTPLVTDLDADERPDVVWYSPGGGPDYWWRMDSSRRLSSTQLEIDGTYVPRPGRLGAGTGVLWYGPGSGVDAIWYR